MVRLLGDGNEMLYGQQRVWGTIGFGIFALIGGYTMSIASNDQFSSMKSCFPAACICIACVCIDLACCRKLNVSTYII